MVPNRRLVLARNCGWSWLRCDVEQRGRIISRRSACSPPPGAYTVAEATQPGGPAVAVVDGTHKETLARRQCTRATDQFSSSDAERAKQKDAGQRKWKRRHPAGRINQIVGIVPATRTVVRIRKSQWCSCPSPRFSKQRFSSSSSSMLFCLGRRRPADVLRRTVRSVDRAGCAFAQDVRAASSSNADLWLVRAGTLFSSSVVLHRSSSWAFTV